MNPMGDVAVVPKYLKGCIVEEGRTGTHDGSFWVGARSVFVFDTTLTAAATRAEWPISVDGPVAGGI